MGRECGRSAAAAVAGIAPLPEREAAGRATAAAAAVGLAAGTPAGRGDNGGGLRVTPPGSAAANAAAARAFAARISATRSALAAATLTTPVLGPGGSNATGSGPAASATDAIANK